MDRAWEDVDEGPHILQSRVPSAFVPQSHHHTCTTTAPRASVSTHTHPYHTRLFLHAPAHHMHIATLEYMWIVYGRMWMRGPHGLQSRVPSAFVPQSHHHACTTTAPQTSVSTHTHPYHTRLFLHAPAHPMRKATPECMWIVYGRMWMRGRTSCSRESHPRSYHSHIITRAQQRPPEPVSACTLTHITHASFSTLPHTLCT